MHISTLLIAPLLPFCALATHLRAQVPASNIIPNPSSLPPTTIASLQSLLHSYTAPLSTANFFDFRNVSAGSYLLDVRCASHAFTPLRIDVHAASPDASEKVEVWGTFRGNEWGNKGEVVEVQNQGVEGEVKSFDVRVLEPKNYYVERKGFSPLSLLKNPMILMAGVGMLVVFGMPYLMDNMDPEMKAEFEKQQKSSPLAALSGAAAQPGGNPLGDFDPAAWLAGTSKKTDSGSANSGGGVSR